MYPALYALARQRVEERINQHAVPSGGLARRASVSPGRTLHRARTSLGTVLVIAGNRLLVAEAAHVSGRYVERKAS